MIVPDWVRRLEVPTPFPVGPVNCWLILRDPVTLIDAGPDTPEAAAALRRELEREGIAVDAIARLLLTHGHHDHFGAGDWLRRSNPRLAVHASPLDGHHFRKDRDIGALREHLVLAGLPPPIRDGIAVSIAEVDRYAAPLGEYEPLSGGETLAGDGWSLDVVATPGHTPGSLSFRIGGDDGTDLLATGDTVLAHITPNAVVDRDPEDPTRVYSSLSNYLASLDTVEAVAARELLPGHGVTIEKIGARLDRERMLRTRRELQVLRSIVDAGRPQTVWELVGRIFPDVDRLNVFLAFSELVGNLLWLAERGWVESVVEDGLERHRSTARGREELERPREA